MAWVGRGGAGHASRERFLTELTLDPPQATSDEAGPPHQDEDYLILSTIHSAKGQEWPAVTVLNVVDWPRQEVPGHDFFDVPAYRRHLEDEAARSLLTEVALESRELPNRGRQLVDTVRRLRDQAVDRRMMALARELARPDLDDPGRRNILGEQQALRNSKREPLQPYPG